MLTSGFLLVNACSAKNVVVDQAVQVYVPAACGDASNASATYTGLGDFQPESDPTEVVKLSSTGLVLAQPPGTRELVLAPLTDAGPWAGAALIPTAGDVDLLALPQNRACHFSATTESPMAGMTLGLIDATHALLIGGSAPPFPAFVADLATSVVTKLASLTPPRNFATITPFNGGVLLAGGEDPSLPGGEVLATATLYTPVAGAAPGSLGTAQTINLAGVDREQHAAVALPDGRVLLVGGVTSHAASPAFLTAIDVFTPGQAEYVAQSTPLVARRNPTVLALPTGQVFIGGGIGTNGEPVTTVEWLALPGLASLGSVELCSAGVEQGFAVTEEGAVLAVMGPGPGTPGCSNVHLIRPPSATSAAVVEEAPTLDPPPAHIRIFQGPSASPVLVTDAAVLRWNPWSGSFSPLSGNGGGVSVTPAGSLAPSPGLALWLGQDEHVWALRFDTRGPYATDFAHPSYLDTDDLYTAPDRLSGADVRFSVETGATLTNGASIFLTDATFLGVTASVQVLHGHAVTFVFRDPTGLEVTCTATGVADAGMVTALRSGSSVTISAGGASPVACPGTLDPNVRVAVGLRSPPGVKSSVRSLTVTR